MTDQMTPLRQLEADMRAIEDPVAAFRDGLIGANTMIETPFGRKKMIYADYVASGRALGQIEQFVMSEVLPFYANSHTEQSYCGARMTALRAEAREIIAEKCGANTRDHAVIFGGSGATTGLNQLVHLFGVKDAVARKQRVVVIVGPYEHHSNILPWRESGATVLEVQEADGGGVDLQHLQDLLRANSGAILIGAFSAASNVTGVGTDAASVSTLIKAHGGRVVWDFAGGGPYLPMSMAPNGIWIDAIVVSPHKFVGGPGASGVLIVRRDAVSVTRPSRPGGGTVLFVNAFQHDYVTLLEQREEGGTPNVIGDIRAALAFIAKDVVGQDRITDINRTLRDRAFEAWADDPQINLLGADYRDRLPIFSFAPRRKDGSFFNYAVFTRALSDRFGIQARGGCSCAGPYVHRLLGIDNLQSNQLRAQILSGDESNKPGFVRLNFSYLMSEKTVSFILEAIPALIHQLDHECAA